MTEVSRKETQFKFKKGIHDLLDYSPIRFKENAVISKELKRLVQSDPSNVCDIPEALALFTSDISADSETAGMVNVLVWKTVPPVSALAFFSQQFHQNPYTAQYAVDVLRSYPPVRYFFSLNIAVSL